MPLGRVEEDEAQPGQPRSELLGDRGHPVLRGLLARAGEAVKKEQSGAVPASGLYDKGRGQGRRLRLDDDGYGRQCRWVDDQGRRQGPRLVDGTGRAELDCCQLLGHEREGRAIAGDVAAHGDIGHQ